VKTDATKSKSDSTAKSDATTKTTKTAKPKKPKGDDDLFGDRH
jgi:hypothetical protein